MDRPPVPELLSSATGLSGSDPGAHVRLYPTGGFRKFMADTVSVFELNFLPALKHWYVTVLLAAGFPLPWFYVTRAIAPDDPQVLRRLLAGTLVFGVAFSIGMLVGQNFVGQRFTGALRLLITMPVSKGAYVLGSLAHSSLSGAMTVSHPARLCAGGRGRYRSGMGVGAIDHPYRAGGERPDAVRSQLCPVSAGRQPRYRSAVTHLGCPIARLLHNGPGASSDEVNWLHLPFALCCRRDRKVAVWPTRRLARTGHPLSYRPMRNVPWPMENAVARKVAQSHLAQDPYLLNGLRNTQCSRKEQSACPISTRPQ